MTHGERTPGTRTMHTYCVYRFCCFFRSNLLLETSSNGNSSNSSSSARRMERKRRQMCLHCDENDGGDRFLMALTGTSLCYQERREKRIVPYLGRQSLRRCKIDWFENVSKKAYLTSNYLLIVFFVLFLSVDKKNEGNFIIMIIVEHLPKCFWCQNNLNSRRIYSIYVKKGWKTSLSFRFRIYQIHIDMSDRLGNFSFSFCSSRISCKRFRCWLLAIYISGKKI